MASFTKGGNPMGPFGKNVYLRSTQGCKFESYTVAASTVPTETVDGTPIKILQPGTAMAKITSGPDAGKIGPFQAGVTDGRENVANLVGLNDTFLPWQLMERDVEVAVLYIGTAVQGWCFELDGTGARVPLSDTVANAMRGTKGMDITFK